MPQPNVPGIDPQLQALCDGFRHDYRAIQAEIGKIRTLSPTNWFGEYLRNLAAAFEALHPERRFDDAGVSSRAAGEGSQPGKR